MKRSGLKNRICAILCLTVFFACQVVFVLPDKVYGEAAGADLTIRVQYLGEREEKIRTKAVFSRSELEAMGASVIGCNCSGGPDELQQVVEELSRYTELPLVAQPNAGLPLMVDGKVQYPLGAEQFADEMKKFLPYQRLPCNGFGSQRNRCGINQYPRSA